MPCFNEADGLEETLEALIGFLSASGLRFGIVVQDDCSTDASHQLLSQIALRHSQPILIEQNQRNLGHGQTSIRAYSRSLEVGSRWVLFLDSDGQFELEDLRYMVAEATQSRPDVVLGVRQFRVDPWYRRFASRTLRIVLRLRFGIIAKDANTPIRLYSAAVLKELLPTVRVQTIIPNIWLTVVAQKARLCVSQVPIRHRRRAGFGATGTMWRNSRPTLLGPVRRFVRFSTRAAAELLHQ